jgi:hypothetical protein
MRRIKNISLALAILGQTMTAVICQAQSTFHFDNWNDVDAPVFDSAGNRLSGTDYVAMLYGGPTGDSLAPATIEYSSTQVMSPVPFTFPLPGYFDRSGWVGIPTVPGGGTARLQVRAWDARLGASYEDVVALGLGGYGESGVFQGVGGDPNATGVPIPPAPLYGLQSFSLRPVIPEPSAALLLLLGLPWLFFRPRRNK